MPSRLYRFMRRHREAAMAEAEAEVKQRREEADYICALDWKMDQVLAYSERINGIYRRLDGYLFRRNMP